MFQINDPDFTWAITKAAFVVISGSALVAGLAWAAFWSALLIGDDRRRLANDDMPNRDRLSVDQTKRVAS
jgi:hypothetical protein